MEIEICKPENTTKINHYNEYNDCIIVYVDNIKIKSTIDYRYYRNRELEALALLKTKSYYYFFNKEPKRRYYYYDKEMKKQITLRLDYKYLFVGFNNTKEIIKKYKYDAKYKFYYCKK